MIVKGHHVEEALAQACFDLRMYLDTVGGAVIQVAIGWHESEETLRNSRYGFARQGEQEMIKYH